MTQKTGTNLITFEPYKEIAPFLHTVFEDTKLLFHQVKDWISPHLWGTRSQRLEDHLLEMAISSCISL